MHSMHNSGRTRFWKILGGTDLRLLPWFSSLSFFKHDFDRVGVATIANVGPHYAGGGRKAVAG